MGENVETPSTPEQFRAVLLDKQKVNDLLANGKFGEFVNDYVTASSKADTRIMEQVREETQATLAQWLKDNRQESLRSLNLSPTDGVSSIPQQRSKLYNAKAPGAVIDKDYKGSADFMQAIWHHRDTLPNSGDLAAKAMEWKKVQNSFGSVVPADGGFLIPETLRSELLSVSLETSIVRPRARVIPMNSLRVPIPKVDSTSNVSSVFGGIVAYWTEEGATLTESQASFGRTVLEAKKLTAYCETPNELVADAPAFGAFLDSILPEAMSFYEDDGFINGSGVGEPLGYLNASSLVQVDRAGSSSGTIAVADIANMYARMLPASLNRAVWVCSPAVIGALLQLDTGTGGVPLWLTGGALFGSPTMSLLGRPLIVTEKVPTLGTASDLTFVDFGFYLLGDRQVMQAMSSPHFKFASDKTAYRIIERVDGRPWLDSAITPKNGGDTLSPFVGLTTA